MVTVTLPALVRTAAARQVVALAAAGRAAAAAAGMVMAAARGVSRGATGGAGMGPLVVPRKDCTVCGGDARHLCLRCRYPGEKK